MAAKRRAKWAKQKREFAEALVESSAQPDATPDDSLWEAFEQERSRKDKLADQRAQARRERACTSKMRYDTKEEAEATIAALGTHGIRNLATYPCPWCKGWHLTSHPR